MTPAQIKTMQGRIGFTVGRGLDGIAGRGTYTRLFERMGAKPDVAAAMGLSASVNFPRYGIDEQPMMIGHWLGQCYVETGAFKYTKEIWGPTKAQRGYEGRADLGNTQQGDGKLYLGRSVGMLTGRGNYRMVAAKMGIDIEADPALVERWDIGLWAFCIWWDENDANRWVKTGDARPISRLVNRGNANADDPANHEAERIAATNKAFALVM